jgi:hypothetical protein
MNLRGVKEPPDGLVYVGNRQWQGKARVWPASPLGNPYRDKTMSRAERVRLYRPHLAREILEGNEKVLDALAALKEDSVLGCWCKPDACHGDVVVEAWQALQADRLREWAEEVPGPRPGRGLRTRHPSRASQEGAKS